jgi:3-oxo-5-alpha-steroid 4-dehydrogenase 3
MDHVRPTTPAEACQAFYIFASASILGINVLPADLRSALMDYGARLQDSSKKTPGKLAWIPGLLRVPHSWFLHYYILSLACSAFWAWQYLTRGSVMEWLVKGQVRDGRESVELLQVFVAWGLMTLQGLRRLYESFFVTKPGPSPMSSIHWIVGLVYYLDMSISVWIEGSG